jgi:hypothetical protein
VLECKSFPCSFSLLLSKLRKAILSACDEILYIIKLWWNFCLDLLSSKFWLIGEWSIDANWETSFTRMGIRLGEQRNIKKEWFGKFGFKIDEIYKVRGGNLRTGMLGERDCEIYWKKIVPRKRKKHKILCLTWKVGFPYYFTVSNIFTDALKLLLFKTPKHSLGKNLAVIFF